jgi:hypothetical protein
MKNKVVIFFVAFPWMPKIWLCYFPAVKEKPQKITPPYFSAARCQKKRAAKSNLFWTAILLFFGGI